MGVATGPIVSAMKIYTTLKKSRPKRFIMKKVRAFWNRPTKNFEIEKSRNFPSKFSLKIQLKIFRSQKKSNISISKIFIFIQCSMKISDEIISDFWISKMLVGRFQNALTFFVINRFGRDFLKIVQIFKADTIEQVSGPLEPYR